MLANLRGQILDVCIPRFVRDDKHLLQRAVPQGDKCSGLVSVTPQERQVPRRRNPGAYSFHTSRFPGVKPSSAQGVRV
jgi:hypothetical protein